MSNISVESKQKNPNIVDLKNSNTVDLKNPNITDPIESLYIHVPFCTRKCGYCDFYSLSSKVADFSAFYYGLQAELAATLADIELNNLHLNKLKTLYIGGGTPSVLPHDVMTSIIDLIRKEIGFTQDLEFTVEINPELNGHNTVLAAIEAGANRISIGYQTKQDSLLQKIGRLHSYEDFLIILNLIRESGIENISCDLMFGLPDQTLKDVLESAEQLIELKIPHISFYSLILEQGTLFYKKYAEHPELLPSDDLERLMYRELLDLFEQHQYQYYELSSTAKPGFYSKHNYNYWSTKPYLGLGPSAHSYYNGIRRGNVRSFKKWSDNPFTSAELEPVNFFQAMQEYAMLTFRLAVGFSPEKFKQRFGINQPFDAELERLLNKDLIYYNSNTKSYILTKKGLDFGNQVFIEFV
ncbi:MAG TPA: radical SAM family heme chaperone HemW [Clostridiaceae bacterium]|nr:radical SAM family heme chaperone HemW [Clostridiaceae bacterium]